MSLLQSFILSAAGMTAQQKRINVASENIANVNTTKTPEGGPYQKKDVLVAPVPISFESSISKYLGAGDIRSPQVVGVQARDEAPRRVYDPNHPHADDKGFVGYPNISSTEEMVTIMSAVRTYEANITAFNSAKTMLLKTLDIGGV